MRIESHNNQIQIIKRDHIASHFLHFSSHIRDNLFIQDSNTRSVEQSQTMRTYHRAVQDITYYFKSHTNILNINNKLTESWNKIGLEQITHNYVFHNLARYLIIWKPEYRSVWMSAWLLAWFDARMSESSLDSVVADAEVDEKLDVSNDWRSVLVQDFVDFLIITEYEKTS